MLHCPCGVSDVCCALVATHGSTASLLTSQPAGSSAPCPAQSVTVCPSPYARTRTALPGCTRSRMAKLASVPGYARTRSTPQCTCSQHAAPCAHKRGGVGGPAGPTTNCRRCADANVALLHVTRWRPSDARMLAEHRRRSRSSFVPCTGSPSTSSERRSHLSGTAWPLRASAACRGPALPTAMELSSVSSLWGLPSGVPLGGLGCGGWAVELRCTAYISN
jgi:hypothetical protein